MTKPILIVDADFVNDLFGRSVVSEVAGRQALTELLQTYDIRITSTVLAEISAGQATDSITGNAFTRGDWFLENNVFEYDTSNFNALPNDAGERSIASVVDPDYVDIELGQTTNEASKYPSSNNAKLL